MLLQVHEVSERGAVLLRLSAQAGHDAGEAEEDVGVFAEAGWGLRRSCSTEVMVQTDQGSRSASSSRFQPMRSRWRRSSVPNVLEFGEGFLPRLFAALEAKFDRR